MTDLDLQLVQNFVNSILMSLFDSNIVKDLDEGIDVKWLKSKGFVKGVWGSPKRRSENTHGHNLKRLYFPECQTVWDWYAEDKWNMMIVSMTWFPKDYEGGVLNYIDNRKGTQIKDPKEVLLIDCERLARANDWETTKSRQRLKFRGQGLEGQYILFPKTKAELTSILIEFKDLIERYNKL